MGGHGGLNILPQKRWNVYNFDNREKVRKDEEEAAKAEQLKREQSRKRDTEFRIQQLRQARGLPSPSPSPSSPAPSTQPVAAEPKPSDTEPKSKHINLFEGIKFMDPVEVVDDKRKAFKRMKKEEDKSKPKPKPKADVLPEDEKYRLGYGVCGKGVKVPWYMEKRLDGDGNGGEEGGEETGSGTGTGTKSVRKKSVEELREERLKREGKEKERERALLKQKGRGGVSVLNDRGYSRRR